MVAQVCRRACGRASDKPAFSAIVVQPYVVEGVAVAVETRSAEKTGPFPFFWKA
jgi:hypothetical protein